MAEHNNLGRKGELLAENYLYTKGYEIIDRNWSHNRQEIDIIAIDNEFIVFIEVKTRSSSFWGNPEDAVTENKINRIVNAADFYISKKNIDKPARFDIISIILTKQDIDINHIEDAFLAPLT